MLLVISSTILYLFLKIKTYDVEFMCTIYIAQTMVTKQIEETKQLLNDKWYGQIKATLLKATKKKHVPDILKKQAIKRFYNTVSALMSQNLSDITIRSLKQFTDFMCDFGVRFWLTFFLLLLLAFNIF